MVIVIGWSIEAVPKSKSIGPIKTAEVVFFGLLVVSNYCTFKPLEVGPYMHFSMHYFKTQVLNLTNALFQLRYDARRCFVLMPILHSNYAFSSDLYCYFP